MTACKQCGKPVTGRSRYCCDSCKTVYNRNKRNKKPEQIITGTPKPEQRPLNDVLYGDLYRRLCSYPGMSWKPSLEYAEIMYRLYTLTVDQLELEGQFVPCWKYQEAA